MLPWKLQKLELLSIYIYGKKIWFCGCLRVLIPHLHLDTKPFFTYLTEHDIDKKKRNILCTWNYEHMKYVIDTVTFQDKYLQSYI
jgi:hypothetical protein